MSYGDFIASSLKKASKIANNNFGKISGEIKGADNNQVLTKADLDIGNFLVNSIRNYYKDFNIIDEEVGVINNKSSFTWVVDPIDGTSNFVNSLPMYGIMLSLLKDDRPIIGGVALPYFNEIYMAEKNRGTFCNGRRIKVTNENNLMKSLIVYAIDGHQEDPQLTEKECRLMKDIILNIRNLRSTNCCFDLMMVASGKYGGWLNRTSKIWDNVAPQIIIEEAGGVYTDFIGNKMNYSNPLTKVQQNFTTCASSPALHIRLQELISKHSYND